MSTSAPPAWGAIFDWDGVVIDSSAQHEESWNQLAAELGRPHSHADFLAGFGRKNEWIIPELLGWATSPAEIQRLSLRKEELYREIIRRGGLETLPGVREWLAQLREGGIPRVVGSSSHRENIELSLGVLGLRDDFDAMVTSEDVSHGKPDPEVFLKAAEKLGLPASRCVVFEDAFAGLEAARRAGAKVVAVATTNPIETLIPVADRAVHRLDELKVAELGAWFGRDA